MQLVWNSADHSPLVGQIPLTQPCSVPSRARSQDSGKSWGQPAACPMPCPLPAAQRWPGRWWQLSARGSASVRGQRWCKSPGGLWSLLDAPLGEDPSITCLWATPGRSGCTCIADSTGLRLGALPARPSLEGEQSSSLMSLSATESHSHGLLLASCPNTSCR